MSKWLPRRLRLFYRKAFREYLLLTNTAAAVLIGGCGDYLEQRLERVKPNDWYRTGRFCALGLIFGPLEHTWYTLLDRRLPGTSHKTVFTKVLVDEAIMTPPLYCIFYPSLALLEGKSRREALQELRAKFWPTFKVACTPFTELHAIIKSQCMQGSW